MRSEEEIAIKLICFKVDGMLASLQHKDQKVIQAKKELLDWVLE